MKVSLIGTGLMGRPMALRLLEKGHQVTVFNRTAAKTEPLVEAGADMAGSAIEAIESSDLTILMLTDEPAIRAVLSPQGAMPHLAGRTILQMGTIGASESRNLGEDVEAVGGEYFEAPVMGSRGQAAAGTLIMAVGASPKQFERWKSLLSCFGPDPQYVGEVGQAAAVKLAFNQLIAAHISSFSLSLGIVRREGVDVEEFMEILRRSGIYARTYDKKLPRLLQRDFSEPNFRAELLLKDVDLIRDETLELGLDGRVVDAIRGLVVKALEMELGEDDYSTIYNAVDPA